MITETEISELAGSIRPDLQILFLEIDAIHGEIDELGKLLYEGEKRLDEGNTPEERLRDLFYRVDEIRSRVNDIKLRQNGNVETALTAIENKIESAFKINNQAPQQEETA